MKSETTSTSGLLPVFLWIHGGASKHGNNTGDEWGPDAHQYDGRFLALQEEIGIDLKNQLVGRNQLIISNQSKVFVSINYRLNSFGYLIWKGDKGHSEWETEINGEPKSYKYQNYNGNLAVYDAELAFQWVRRNIRHFGGDPERITIGGASAGSGLAGVVTSLESVGPYIKGIIQQSGEGLAPTTGFAPPPSWNNDPLFNLKRIAGYSNCDMTSEDFILILYPLSHKNDS